VVTEEVVQRESVVCGDEVYARARTTAIMLIEIGAAGESICHFADAALVASPKTAHRVAKFSVPLRPNRREISNLIAAFADVPRFRDQFYLRNNRVLLDRLEKRMEFVHAVCVAGERAG